MTRDLQLQDPALVGQSAVVSASAGSGKTFTLTVLSTGTLGRGPLRPHDLLATTFSEAAASDLKARLLRPLDLLAALDFGAWSEALPAFREGGTQAFGAWLETQPLSPRLGKAKQEVLHASALWCGEGSILPEWTATPARAQAFWRRTRREAEVLRVSTLHSLAATLLRQGGRAPRQILEAEHPKLLRCLRQVVREALAYPGTHPDHGAAQALLSWAEKDWERLSLLHDGHRDAMGILVERDTTPLRQQAEALFQQLAKACHPFFVGSQAFFNSTKTGKPRGDAAKFLRLGAPPQASGWAERMRWCDALAEAAFTQDEAKQFRMSEQTYPAAFIAALQPLLPLASLWEDWLGAVLERALLAFDHAKTERGLATFGDLIRLAQEGLTSGAILAPRPGLLIVDEYQDTSPSQDAFLEALGATHTVIVGDIKQSIYGWRGGDPELLRRRLATAGEAAFRLPDNFRSSTAIVELANTFVDELWPQLDPQVGPLDGHQTPTRGGNWPVGFHQAEEGQGRKLPDFIDWIAALATEAGWTAALGAAESGKPRTRALLLRQRSQLPALLLALKRRGLRAYVVSQAGFWESPGIRLLMAALEAVAHPDRGLPCAVLLRHLAGMKDGELTRMAQRDRRGLPGLGRLEPELLPAEHQAAARWLQELLGCTAQGVAGRLLAHGRLLHVLSTFHVHGNLEPERARRNLASFLSLLSELSASPAEAFATLDELRAGKERGDVPASPEGVDLILHTVHASKGLEYDDVILPTLGWKPRVFSAGTVRTDATTHALAFPWRLGPLKGERYRRLEKQEAALQRRDSLNLLYVALTRAKERLAILCAPPKSGETAGSTWADWASALAATHGALKPLTQAPPLKVETLPSSVAPAPARAPRWERLPMPPELPAAVEASERALRKRQGEAMHDYLQGLLMRWADPSAFASLLEQPPAVPRARDMALALLDALELRGWRHLPRRTEYPLLGAAASGATGRADLVIWEPDRSHTTDVYLLDYKLSEDFGPEELAAYTAQMGRYARALGHPDLRVHAYLVALKSGRWVEVSLPLGGAADGGSHALHL